MLPFALIAALAIAALIYEKRQNSVREREWALERGALLQRIQDPRRAVAEHAPKATAPSPPPISTEDDARFAELRRRREELTNGTT